MLLDHELNFSLELKKRGFGQGSFLLFSFSNFVLSKFWLIFSPKKENLVESRLEKKFIFFFFWKNDKIWWKTFTVEDSHVEVIGHPWPMLKIDWKSRSNIRGKKVLK